MGSSSKKWAKFISRIAARVYFLLIILQIPLFRFPCNVGACRTPIEVVSSQLLATKILPVVFVKALLYPGAVVKAIINNSAIPSHNNLLKLYKSSNLKDTAAIIHLNHLEVLAGCYLSVAGALLSLVRSGRLSLFGILLIIWGIGKEIFLGQYATNYPSKTISIHPMMFIALISALFSIKDDVRSLIRSWRPKNVRSYSKAKYR